MRMYDIIKDKRDGKRLSDEQIDFAVKGFTCGDIPDYQMSAFAHGGLVSRNGRQRDCAFNARYVQFG